MNLIVYNDGDFDGMFVKCIWLRFLACYLLFITAPALMIVFAPIFTLTYGPCFFEKYLFDQITCQLGCGSPDFICSFISM